MHDIFRRFSEFSNLVQRVRKQTQKIQRIQRKTKPSISQRLFEAAFPGLDAGKQQNQYRLIPGDLEPRIQKRILQTGFRI